MSHSPDGVLVIDKPSGVTSHDVVAIARRVLGEKRIGHTGTLDPLATGVLPLACGRATRLVRFLTASDKDYEAAIRFGVTTDSYDVTGAETSRSGRVPAPADVEAALAGLTGEYLQTPPEFSAKKVGGHRAYALARAQKPVELRAVPVHVRRAAVVRWTDASVVVALTCSAGFYVRTFAHELGRRTGTGACLEALRRTRSGEFDLARSVPMDLLTDAGSSAAGWLIPMRGLLHGFAGARLTDEGMQRVAHGREVIGSQIASVETVDAPADWVRLLGPDGDLVAMARPGIDPGSLHPSVVLI